jgi:hypothetical protein
MKSRSKTPQPASEIDAQNAHDQEPRVETRLNPAGLTITSKTAENAEKYEQRQPQQSSVYGLRLQSAGNATWPNLWKVEESPSMERSRKEQR